VTTLDAGDARAFEHEAFIYDHDDDYVGTLAPLMTAALAAGDAVLAVVPGPRADLLRAALGPSAGDVTWFDACEWYQQPTRTIAGYEQTLRALGPGTHAFVVGEVQFGDTERGWTEWTRYESVLNRALERHSARVVCPYDARALPSRVVEDARRTHRYLLGTDARQVSDTYIEPESLLLDVTVGTVPPSGAPDVDVQVGNSVRDGRHAFEAAAAAWGLARAQAHKLSIAISEVLTNAVIHGGGRAWLRIWCRDDGLTCMVDDAGSGSDDALLGYLPPVPGAMSGYGLWLTRQLFDRAELSRSPRGGMRVLLTLDS